MREIVFISTLVATHSLHCQSRKVLSFSEAFGLKVLSLMAGFNIAEHWKRGCIWVCHENSVLTKRVEEHCFDYEPREHGDCECHVRFL